jgi:hypothetical protein
MSEEFNKAAAAMTEAAGIIVDAREEMAEIDAWTLNVEKTALSCTDKFERSRLQERRKRAKNRAQLAEQNYRDALQKLEVTVRDMAAAKRRQAP